MVVADVDKGVMVQSRDSLVDFAADDEGVVKLIASDSSTAAETCILTLSRLSSAGPCGLDMDLVASIAPLITATSSPVRRFNTGGTPPLTPPCPPRSESRSGMAVGMRSAKRKRW